jgi:hypothetical protein
MNALTGVNRPEHPKRPNGLHAREDQLKAGPGTALSLHGFKRGRSGGLTDLRPKRFKAHIRSMNNCQLGIEGHKAQTIRGPNFVVPTTSEATWLATIFARQTHLLILWKQLSLDTV